MKRVCIHQPDFAPWLGFFDRLVDCDLYLVLDDVQFLRRGWHHRDKIKTAQGPAWLTLPVVKGPREQRIDEVRIHPGARMDKLVDTLRHAYRRAPAFDRTFEGVAAILASGHDRLIDVNRALIDHLLGALGIDVPQVCASDFGVTERATERLIALLRHVEATHYVTGTGSLDYLDRDAFEAAGITLEVRTFAPRPYPQLHGAFAPGLSALDALFNCGADARALIGSPEQARQVKLAG